MNEKEFRTRFSEDEPKLKAWGDFVSNAIYSELVKSLSESCVQALLQIPPLPRVKDVESAIEKTFSRKDYQDKYEEMTDKVGTRFVTVLAEDIDKIESAIRAIDIWDISDDKDYLRDRESFPDIFGYQSRHFVVRAKGDLSIDDIIVPRGMPCEIQIRSMLQHVYSEVTHKSIYKYKLIEPTNSMRRDVARSMALLETADHLLSEVRTHAESANKEANEIIEGLTAVYRDVVKRDPIVNSKAELILLSSVMDKIRGNTSNIKEFFADKSALARRIGENSDNADFFKIPTIIAIYMLVYEDDLYIKRTWPFDSRDNVLEMIFTDLGKSLARD